MTEGQEKQRNLTTARKLCEELEASLVKPEAIDMKYQHHAGANETIDTAKLLDDLDAKFNLFNARFNATAHKVGFAMEKIMIGKPVSKPEEFKNRPKVCSAKAAAKFMAGRKKIMILTGAGISAASGIPTFRGEDGFWKQTKRYADEDDCMKICTKDFFKRNPQAYWQWHYDFIKLASSAKPN